MTNKTENKTQAFDHQKYVQIATKHLDPAQFWTHICPGIGMLTMQNGDKCSCGQVKRQQP